MGPGAHLCGIVPLIEQVDAIEHAPGCGPHVEPKVGPEIEGANFVGDEARRAGQRHHLGQFFLLQGLPHDDRTPVGDGGHQRVAFDGGHQVGCEAAGRNLEHPQPGWVRDIRRNR